jgi:CubicO group peptidase (beta-lactamase class C family)
VRTSAYSRRDVVAGLRTIRAKSGIPGISAGVSHEGERCCVHAGVADLVTATPLSDSSRFEVSCLMKFFVSLLAQKLLSRRVIALSAPIDSYLPELSGSIAGERIAFGHLLSHTSGYRGLDVSDARIKWGQSWQKLIEQLRSEDLLFPPGNVFSYEHSEHVLAGEILGRVTGRKLDQLMNEEILAPLGIVVGHARRDREEGAFVNQHVPAADHTFVPTKQPAFSEFWRASLPDMTIRLSDVLKIGEWILHEGDESVLDALGTQVIELPSQVTTSKFAELIPTSFGHICGKYSGGMFGHNGSVVGQTVALRIDVLHRAVYVVGINAWMPHVRDTVIRLLSDGDKSVCEWEANNPAEGDGIPPSKMFGAFTPEDLFGTYDGGFGRQVSIERSGTDAFHMLVGAPGARQRRISVSRRQDGLYEFGRSQNLSCVFTAHPVDDSPVLHIGVHTYRRRK